MNLALSMIAQSLGLIIAITIVSQIIGMWFVTDYQEDFN